MKRLICLILTFLMISSVCCTSISAEEAVTDSSYEKYCYDTLVALGILDGRENLDNRITKGEFCDIVVKMLKLDGGYNEEKLYFRDLSPENQYFDSISILAQRGCLLGDDVQRVYPDEYITKNTALIILVRVLGYELIAQQSGGYPTGYMNVWNRLGLDEGISSVSDESFTLSKLSVLIYNTLLAKQVGSDFITADGDLSIRFEGGDTLLYSLYNGLEFRGIVNQNEFSSVTSIERYDQQMVKIGNVEMRTADTSVNNYLGYMVKGIMTESVKGEGDYTLISFTENQYNNELIIRSSEISAVPDIFTVNYERDNTDKIRTAKLKRNVSVIYNYQYLTSYTVDDLDIDTGYLKLVDNDRDGVYDVVFVYEYKTYFVSSVDSYSSYIYDKYGYPAVEVDDKTIITNADGMNLSISAIRSKDIVAVYEPKVPSNDGITVVVKSNALPILGVAETIYTEDGNTFVEIEGIDYRISDRYSLLSAPDADYRKIQAGMMGTFYIDDNMEICAFEDSSNDYAYAYLTGLRVDDWKSISSCKVFTQYGKFTELSFHKNLTINGTRVTDIYELDQHTLLCSAGNAIPQLIKYRTNSEGLIVELFLSDGSVVSPMNYDDKAVNYNETIVDGEMRSSGRKYNYRYIYDDNTVIFIIPADLTQERNFRISNKVFADGQKVTMRVFDADSSYLMKAGIIDGGNVSVDYASEQYLVVVTKTGIAALNEDQETVDAIHGYYKGEERRYESDRDDDWFNGFNEGDIVHILFDTATGSIIGSQKIFTFDDAPGTLPTTDAIIYHNEFAKKMPHSINPATSRLFGATGMVYGVCISKGDSYLTLSMDNGISGDPFITDKNTLVYVVEKTGNGVKVASSSMDAIVVSSSPSAVDGSKVLINTRNLLTKEIFIIKE